MRQGLPAEPAEPFASTPSAQTVELGRALAARAGDATTMAAQAAASAGLSELASRGLAKRIRHVHNVATRAVANQLTTGRGTSEKERHFIGKLGVAAAVRGASVATLVRSYLMWRDANLAVLAEEVVHLGTPAATAEEAYGIVRSSADMGMVRLARAYDSHIHLVGRREDSSALALRDVEAQLALASSVASKKNTELSTALAEISEKNQQLVGVNQQQSLFISNISHELRTPLAGILGHTELLLAERSTRPVGLLDLDVEFGDSAVYLNLHPNLTLADLRSSPASLIDEAQFEGFVTESGSVRPVSYTHLTLPTICSV